MAVSADGTVHVAYHGDGEVGYGIKPAGTNAFTTFPVYTDSAYTKGNFNFWDLGLTLRNEGAAVYYSAIGSGSTAIYFNAVGPTGVGPQQSLVAVPGESYPWLNAMRHGGAALGHALVYVCGDPNSGAALRSHVATSGQAGFAPYGGGCAGTSGKAPRILASGVPSLGNAAFAVQLADGPASSAAVLHLGISRASYGGILLPLDLSLIGMSGCTLFTSIQGYFGAGTSITGSASLGLPIPATPFLGGSEAFLQWICVDPGANPASLTASGGGHVLLR
jgi:hypothetical protein